MLVPASPGVASALGLLATDVRRDDARAVPRQAAGDTLAADAIGEAFDQMETQGRADLRRDGFGPEAVAVARHADLRYVGQSYEMR